MPQVQDASRNSGELRGGARISHIFRSEFFDALEELDACEGLTDEDIIYSIRQATGPRAPLFNVSEVSFEVLAKRQIALMRPHVSRAVEEVRRPI